MQDSEQLDNLLENQIKSLSFETLLRKIVKRERFELKFFDAPIPQKNFLIEILAYLLLRQKSNQIYLAGPEELAKRQQSIRQQLQSRRFDFQSVQAPKSKLFIERIVLLSQLIQQILNRVELPIKPILTAQQAFIILLYLASGKLVAIKSFELAKKRMRRHLQSYDRFSTFASLHSSKTTKRNQPVRHNSELISFLDEVKQALRGESPPRPKKSALSRRIYALSQSPQHRASVHKSKIVSFQEKDRATSKMSSLANSRKRVSLDKTLNRVHFRPTFPSSEKSRTQILKFGKILPRDSKIGCISSVKTLNFGEKRLKKKAIIS